MRSSLIEVLDIGSKDTLQLLLVKDEQVIETLASHTSQKAFTDGIGSWRVIRRFQDLDAAGCGHASETGSKFAITIAKEIFRCLPIGSCFPELLGRPGVCRRACDPHVDDLTSVYVNDEEGKE